MLLRFRGSNPGETHSCYRIDETGSASTFNIALPEVPVKTPMIRVHGTLRRTDKHGRNLIAQKTRASQRDFSWADREKELDFGDILQEERAGLQQGPDTGV